MKNHSELKEVPIKISFPEEEKKIEEFWNETKAFETSLELSKDKPTFSFYDGPPFATGLPHYGHILAGTIKDTVTRYAHQTGHYVDRRFGWDCHGLPIEFVIDEELNLKTRQSVIEYGIGNYNEKCRDIVMKYSSEWEVIVKRLGRWIDFKDDYKTMDVEFMESVWWVFKQLWEKELVYRGVKVMPFSVGCHTPLSNFEANLDYREIEDPALTVSFPLVEDENTHMVAWTTTPWTLPSNLALCVNPEFIYLKLKDKEKQITYIVAKDRLEQVYPPKKVKKGEKVELPYEIVGEIKGSELKGKKYRPMFDYFIDEEKNGAFQVLNGTWVTNDSGTGVVHCAPGFGADDYDVCLQAGIITKTRCPSPVDDNGCFTSEIKDFVGLSVSDKDTEIKLKVAIKNKGRMVRSDTTKHNYPFCWRSETKLLYKAVPSWFVNVEVLRDRLVENNKQTRWVPEFVGEKRFHNWLEGASDWCISRNRFWGTPIPIWTNEDFTEFEVIGSLKELEEKTGHKATDIHRHKIDHLVIKGKTGDLRRIDEVFDCWFESGSMPYAQQHYPFENKERFETGYFPADFIAEGLDQTRGWFYTLTILSTALFNKPAFKNVIVNGLVLAEDGKKMSKSKKNYPDPMLIINQFGADTLRLYLINSPSVRAEPLKFKESDVKKVLKDVYLPWFNAFRFFVENTKKWEREHDVAFVYDVNVAKKSTNVMDKWILSSTNTLITFVRKEMESYRLYTVLPALIRFIEQLTNWYIRFNRKRLRGNKDNGENLTKGETLEALTTLCYVHLKLVLLMAPASPFFSEYVYQNIKNVLPKNEQQSSVHHCFIPEPDNSFVDPNVEEDMALLQRVIELGRVIRTTKDLALKLPLDRFIIVHASQQHIQRLKPIENYVISELNIKKLVLDAQQSDFVKLVAKLEPSKCGKRLNKDVGVITKEVANWDNQRVQQFLKEGKATLYEKEITVDDVTISRQFTGDEKKQCAQWDDNLLVILDVLVDEEQKKEFNVRTVANKVQKLRKKALIHPKDPIRVYFIVKKGALSDLLNEKIQIIKDTIQKPIFIVETVELKNEIPDGSDTFTMLGSSLSIHLCQDN